MSGSSSSSPRAGVRRRAALGVALGLAAVLGSAGMSAAAPTGDPPSPYHCWLEKELAQLYEDVSPAVVSVSSYRVRLLDRGTRASSSYSMRRMAASGVIVSPSGLLVVPARLAQPGDSILVHFPDGRRLSAKYAGTDPDANITLLRLHGPGPFPCIEPVREGESQLPEWVAAVAHGPWRGPQPGRPSLTLSHKSAVERSPAQFAERTGELWRLHAPISPGNQGGALVSLSGVWVGYITGVVAGASGTGGEDATIAASDEGVILPASLVMRAVREIDAGERARSGFLGVQTDSSLRTAELRVSPGSAGTTGILVVSVLPDSPAERFGLRPGDRILRFEGEEIGSVGDLTRLVAGTRPGQTASVDILRGDLHHNLQVILGDSDALRLFLRLWREQINERLALRERLNHLRGQQRRLEERLHTTPQAAGDLPADVPGS